MRPRDATCSPQKTTTEEECVGLRVRRTSRLTSDPRRRARGPAGVGSGDLAGIAGDDGAAHLAKLAAVTDGDGDGDATAPRPQEIDPVQIRIRFGYDPPGYEVGYSTGCGCGHT